MSEFIHVGLPIIGLTVGLFALIAGAVHIAVGTPTPPSRPRKQKAGIPCAACGHARGWHPTWRGGDYRSRCKASNGKYPYSHQCDCPAGRRSIR